MHKFMKLFLLGGVSYCLLELCSRRRTHWSMGLTGGLCFCGIYLIHTRLQRVPLLLRCLLGGGLVTAAELGVGLLVNEGLGWKVWDYRRQPGNYRGQICPQFSALWCLLCLPLSPLCRWLKPRL